MKRPRRVASRLLCRYGGLTQRAAAGMLGIKSGVAVSCQIKKLSRLMESDDELRRTVFALEQRLDRRMKQASH